MPLCPSGTYPNSSGGCSPLAGGGGSTGGPPPVPSFGPAAVPEGGCDPNKLYKVGHPCNTAGAGRLGRGEERAAGDMPCPDPGTCMDVVTNQCRTFNPNREKVNETDTWDRGPGMGGRGYCRQRDGGGGGGGGGGGAGRGGPGGPGGPGGTFGIGDPNARFDDLFGMFDAQQKTIWDNLAPIMSGQQTRYSPEVMARMDSEAKMNALGQARAGSDSLVQDAIRRGVGRSPIRGLAEVQRGATQSFTQATNQNRIRKAEADFQDRMAALTAAERWLGQMQQYTMGLDATAADREKAIANIALGYARIAAEKEMLQRTLANNLQVANINNNPLNAILRDVIGGS